MRHLLAAAALLLLASCSHPTVVGCPPVAEYPKAFQQQARAEKIVIADLVDLAPDDPLRLEIDRRLAARGRDVKLPQAGTSALGRFTDDYGKMRDQARACAAHG